MTKQPYLLASLALATLACTGQVYAQYAPYAPAGKHDAGATTTNLLLTPDRQAQDEQAFFCRPFFRGYSFGYSSFSYGFGGFGYSSFRFYSPGFAYYRPFIGPYFSYYSFGPVFYPISTVVIEQPIVPQIIHPVQPSNPRNPSNPRSRDSRSSRGSRDSRGSRGSRWSRSSSTTVGRLTLCRCPNRSRNRSLCPKMRTPSRRSPTSSARMSRCPRDRPRAWYTRPTVSISHDANPRTPSEPPHWSR